LPDWVQEGLDLHEGDEIEFVKVPGEDTFVLQKIASSGPLDQSSLAP
jgi:hypothetical protein